MQKTSQKDGAADFASDISSRVSIYSDANFNPPTFNIGQELSLGGTSVVLPADILLKKPARRLKTSIKKK